jgi:hypothetical protein
LKASASGPSLPLSLDWEDWYQLCCPPFDAADAHDRFEDRLVRATELALELCHDLGAHGTWFCLADQARRHRATASASTATPTPAPSSWTSRPSGSP